MTASPHQKILWQQLWGLAILQLAVGWSWQIYSAAQPVILDNFGLITLAGLLSVVPSLLTLILDPLIGQLSDRLQQKYGSRLPALNVGIILTSLIFLTVALGLKSDLLLTFKWVIPVMMIAWVTTMKIFQNPSIALLKRYATPKELPQAVSILTLVGAIVSATKPFTKIGVAQWGSSLAFLLGAVMLILAMTILRWLTPKTIKAPTETFAKPASPTILLRLFIIGSCIQLTSILSGIMIPQTLQSYLPALSQEMFGSLIAIISGISAIPLGNGLKRITIAQSAMISLSGMLGLLTFMSFNLNIGMAIALVIVFGVNSALLYNIGVPLAFACVPAHQASWGIGLFFGGGGAIGTILTSINLTYGDLSLAQAWSLVLGAIVITWLCWPDLPENSSS